jgi:DNA-binding transcriptional MerR regulator
MASKARVQKRLYYKIGEACKALGIQPYVLRYWETEFPALTPSKSRSGQRVYSEKELEIIRRIKELLYEEGYTIAGAKKKLEVELAAGTLGETGEPGEVDAAEDEPASETPQLVTPAIPTIPAIDPAAGAPTGTGAAVPPPPALDTDGDERIQTLLSGIEEALQEAREILTLLGPKSL